MRKARTALAEVAQTPLYIAVCTLPQNEFLSEGSDQSGFVTTAFSFRQHHAVLTCTVPLKSFTLFLGRFHISMFGFQSFRVQVYTARRVSWGVSECVT